MGGDRPDPVSMRKLVIDDLAETFTVGDIDSHGFSLERDGRRIRVLLSPEQLDSYIANMEDSAFRAMGIEPPWKSGVALSAVHILEEAAMAGEGVGVVIDGDVIRREPAPTGSTLPGGGASRWSAVTSVSGEIREFGPDPADSAE